MTDFKKEAYDYACMYVSPDERSHDTYFRNIQTAYIDGATEATKELQKQVIKLKCNCECNHCVYTDSPCTPGDYDKNEIGYCSKYESIYSAIDKAYSEKANAEIKLNEAREIISEYITILKGNTMYIR